MISGDGLDLLTVLNLEINRLALVERKQQLLRDRVVAVTLFEDLERTPSQIAQDDGVGLKVRSDTGEVDVVDAGGQVERKIFPGDEEILVVDGERRSRVLLLQRCRLLCCGEKRKAKTKERDEKLVHGQSPLESRQ